MGEWVPATDFNVAPIGNDDESVPLDLCAEFSAPMEVRVRDIENDAHRGVTDEEENEYRFFSADDSVPLDLCAEFGAAMEKEEQMQLIEEGESIENNSLYNELEALNSEDLIPLDDLRVYFDDGDVMFSWVSECL